MSATVGFRIVLVLLGVVLAAAARGQTNGVLREIFTGLSGASLQTLTNDSNFPNFPSAAEIITEAFEGPLNWGDRYGDRYRALVVPPITGTYVFWVQGDDAAALFLSPDESPWNRVQIAVNNQTALRRMWYTFPSQQSSNIFLQAGKPYYIEAIHSAGTGDDTLAVGWKLPNGTFEQPIPITYLKPFGLAPTTKPVLTSQPTNVTVMEMSSATFHVGVSNLDAVTYQWQRHGSNMAGARGASFTIHSALTNDSGGGFRCIVSNAFGAVTSATVSLTVLADTTAPQLIYAAGASSNTVRVVFSEPLDATATSAVRYALNNGATIQTAAFGESPRVVILTTSPLQRGMSYTLSVNGIIDRAARRNTLAAAQHTFTAMLNGVYREIFSSIPGVSVTELTNSLAFPGLPSAAEIISDQLETADYPTNNYGQRLRARVVAPLTGQYTFAISAHDTAWLYLGTSASPGSAQRIALVNEADGVTARQYDVQPGQRSAPVMLTAGQQYYLDVLMKGAVSTDFPPDHLSVRWQLPNGVIEDPLPAAHLTPEGLYLPIITQHPASVFVVENSPAPFVVSTSNLEPVRYQWQRNGIDVAGATNASYTVSQVTLGEHGSTVRCVLGNALGATNSAEATIFVGADTVRPTIARVVNNGTNRVVVTFSELVDPSTATFPLNYSIPGLNISAASLAPSGDTVTLSTTPFAMGSTHTITINRVRDRASSANVIATNSQASFTAAEFFLHHIGAPPSSTLTSQPGGADITAGNGDFSSTNDAFGFAYALRRGDFDVKVRVARLDLADTWTIASLMAREDLQTTNRYAAVCTTPSIGGTFFQYRATNAAPAQTAGSFPVNHPYTWLRLQRVGGSTFHGYASFDGNTWTRLGTATLPLPSTVYLGFAVSSRSSGVATAQFRDFMENTSTNLGAQAVEVEPLGPSSRRTGLVFTELMYHPAARTDGRRLEFIELHNSNPFYEDLSGYRISGDVSYTFPPGTILPGGGFLVIARNPSDIQAVYGIANVTGPLTNNFSNKSGTVRLRNKSNAILLEINYDSRPPWPASPDGAGHSLTLIRPSWGEGNPVAWAASDRIGGSPGGPDGILIDALRQVVINEFMANTEAPDVDFIELYNRNTTPVDLSGCWLSDDPDTNKFRIPDGTTIPANGFLHYTETQLGFALGATGEGIYFVNSNRTRVVDSLIFEGQERGVATGRSPNGAPAFSRLATPTPGASNAALRLETIVINEIMHNPITRDEDDEFVELHNRGATAVNLGGWRFTDGIDFTFPSNAVVPANGYVVVAKNAARLIANYANLTATNTFGDFDGSLANSGERVALSRPDLNYTTNINGVVQTNTFYIEVDEVNYGRGGRWGDWSDGGGSSLELIDPRSDNRLFSNWGDSDEASKSVWTQISVTGLLDHGPGSDSKNNSLQMYLLDVGECLVDAVSVSIAGSPNLVVNGGFESGLNGWNFQGTHRTCRLENSGFSSANSLRLVATGRGDPGPNRVFTLLTQSYTTGVVGTISARVKWLRGRPEMLLRLRNNQLDLPAVLEVPRNLGTPGARNSRWATNVGPAIAEVNHIPVIPEANQSVLVTARVHDPDGVSQVRLTYRVDPFGSAVNVTMFDHGAGGDAVAGDGVYSAIIPGQPKDTLVAFYVQATDAAGTALTVRYPASAPTQELLVRFGEAQPPSAYGTYRFWITQAHYNNWVIREKLSNEAFPGTFVYGNFRAMHNAGNRYGGSPFHQELLDTPLGTNCDYYVTLPADDKLMGADSFTLQSPGNFGRDLTDQNEQTAYWMARELGVPYLYRRSINVFLNGVLRGRIYEDTQQPGGDFNEEFFEDRGDGDLYKVQYLFDFNDSTDNSSSTPASLQLFTTTGGVKKLARYRQTFTKRAVNDSPHNYTNLFNLVDTMNTPSTGDAYRDEISAALDVREWMTVWALERMVNNSDLYGNRKQSGNVGGQNAYIYKPVNDGWQFLIWDIDFCFSGSPVEYLFHFTDPPIVRLMEQPFMMRAYWQALEDLVLEALVPEKAFPLIDARYQAFLANGIQAVPADSLKRFITVRRDYILQLLTEVRAPFALTSGNGTTFTADNPLATLEGIAPISARRITINGVEYPLTWSSISNWSARVPLTIRTNLLTVRIYDANGAPMPNGTRTITAVHNGPIARAEESIVIHEIMFQPAVTNAEYVELFNRSTNTTFGLTGFRLQGLDFDFHPATLFPPQSYLMVVKDVDAFRTAYGHGARVAGEYDGELDLDGETLTLLRKAPTTNQPDTVISKVKFEIVRPWPDSPAVTSSGVALQLVDAAQDHARVSNWEDATGWRFFSYTGRPGGQRLSMWLDAAGTIYIDDIRLTHDGGAGPGTNLVRNGDFESSLTGTWNWSGSYQGNSAVSTLYAKSGNSSLRLAPTKAGNSSTALYQDISPSPSTSSNFTLSFWFKPSPTATNFTVRLGSSSYQQTIGVNAVAATPGAPNSVAGLVEPYPLLWINEVLPDSAHSHLDNTGTPQPWIELFNSGTNTISLEGLSLSHNYTNLNQWAFPPGAVLLPGQFRVVFVDGRPQFSTGAVLHTNFRLTPTNGSVVLSRYGQILDYVNYAGLYAGESYGSHPDGQLFSRRVFFHVTPGASNNPAPVPIAINEWMASNTRTMVDPLTGTYEDWFELYNFHSRPVDLSGYFMTDNAGNWNKWRIPNGTVLQPFSFQLCWANGTVGTNTTGNALHANFRLAKSGSYLALHSPERVLVDAIQFGPQTSDVSMGRYPDGNVGGPLYQMSSPTPRTNNTISANTHTPVLAQPPNRVVNEGQAVNFTATATDGDLPAQPLTYSIVNGPEGAQIQAQSGAFTWTPMEAQGPGVFQITIGVSDNGEPPRTDSKTFQVTVNEVNVPPMIATLPAQSVTVGAEITFGIPASDTDLPPQSLSFDLLSAPTGAVVNAAGTFSWTPSAAQAPSTNAIVVRAIDNGTPSLSATQSFTIVVSAGNERMAFERITRGADGVVQVQLRGAAGVWELQRSANLLTWQPLRRLTNHTGPLTHTDTTATNATQRFYRAVKQ